MFIGQMRFPPLDEEPSWLLASYSFGVRRDLHSMTSHCRGQVRLGWNLNRAHGNDWRDYGEDRSNFLACHFDVSYNGNFVLLCYLMISLRVQGDLL